MAIHKLLWYIFTTEYYAVDKRIKQIHMNWHKKFSEIHYIVSRADYRIEIKV